MRKVLLGAALLALGLGPGCDRLVRPEAPAVYTPWEEGLTLAFRDPSRPGIPSLQVRVAHYRAEGAGAEVTHTYTTFSGQVEVQFKIGDGGVSLAMPGGPPLRILPAGFPDRVNRWVGEDGRLFQVIGRSRANLPGLRLPDPDALGVWVESWRADGTGLRRRTLLVPNFGEVQALNLEDGHWVEVNRLVGWHFTDVPVVEKR
jgi:hypothetical protein